MLRKNILLKYVKNNGIWMNSRKKINNSNIRCISNTAPTQGGSVYNNKNESNTYDYIIVGAGSAGCVVANRLSSNPNNKVAILEAGGKDWYPWIHVPVGYLYSQGNKYTDWCFKTEPQEGLNGRSIIYPRGKVLGGCSSINGMI